MAVFTYRASEAAAGPAGRATVRGTITADTPRHARDRLRERGLAVAELVPAKPAGGASLSLAGLRGLLPGGRGSVRRTAGAVRELSTLLGVGVPLAEALGVTAAGYHGALHEALLSVRDRVAAGASLATALAGHPRLFDPLAVKMAEVGEKSGQLDLVLGRLADFREAGLGLRDRVTTALLYPAFVLFAAAGVSVFLMTAVVPTLLEGLIEAGRPLPWPTRVLKFLSDGLLTHGVWAGPLLAAAAAGAWAWGRTDAGRRVRSRLAWRLPVVGDMARKQAVARSAGVLAVLMRSGIEFTAAASAAADAASDPVVGDALAACAKGVTGGRGIAEALAAGGAFPPVAVRVFAVGQESGTLEAMLERLAADYERQAASAAARLTAVLEPALILALSAVVGFILFATILPVLEAGRVV